MAIVKIKVTLEDERMGEPLATTVVGEFENEEAFGKKMAELGNRALLSLFKTYGIREGSGWTKTHEAMKTWIAEATDADLDRAIGLTGRAANGVKAADNGR